MADLDCAVVNVGSGTQHSLQDLVAALEEIFGRPIRRVYLPPRPGDVRESLADLAAARRLLAYEPQVDFITGLRRTIEAMVPGERTR